MASYAKTVGNKTERQERIIDLNIYMDPKEHYNRSYQELRAKELEAKITKIVGANKMIGLTYSNRGNWIVEFRSKQDAQLLADSELSISGCNRKVQSKVRSEIGFLITIKCDPLVEDDEIVEQFKPFVAEVYSITHTSYRFNPLLKDGRRLFRIRPSVTLSEIPHHIEIEGVKIALYFAGKSFLCEKCGASHPPQQRCVQKNVIHTTPEAITVAKTSNAKKQTVKTIEKEVEIKQTEEQLKVVKEIRALVDPAERENIIALSEVTNTETEKMFQKLKELDAEINEAGSFRRKEDGDAPDERWKTVEPKPPKKSQEEKELRADKSTVKRMAPPPTPQKKDIKKVQR